MKSTLLIFLCAAALLLAKAPRAFGAIDEVDALLLGNAPADEGQSIAPSSGRPSPPPASSVERVAWQADDVHAAIAGAADAQADRQADPKSAPASTINAVPEPSAIILAVAALGYFLLFGRRRRLA